MKKQIKINGTPVGEIQIGSPAVILEGELTRRTSTVLAIYAESKSKLVFETRNTVYFLQYPESATSGRLLSGGKALIRKLTTLHTGGCQ